MEWIRRNDICFLRMRIKEERDRRGRVGMILNCFKEWWKRVFICVEMNNREFCVVRRGDIGDCDVR